jgi:hypothetical protein
MADIDVVKKGSRAWVWVVLLIVLALILWFVFGMGTTPTTTGQLLDMGQPHLAAAVL